MDLGFCHGQHAMMTSRIPHDVGTCWEFAFGFNACLSTDIGSCFRPILVAKATRTSMTHKQLYRQVCVGQKKKLRPSRAFQGLQRLSRASRGSKSIQGLPRHSEVSWGLPRPSKASRGTCPGIRVQKILDIFARDRAFASAGYYFHA